MIKPMSYRVLVKPDALDEDPTFKRAKAAGIALPEHEGLKIEQMKMDTGVVISLGPTAFKAYAAEAGADVEDVAPKVGQRVGFAKYAGKFQKDPADQVEYLLLADEDINCVLEA